MNVCWVFAEGILTQPIYFTDEKTDLQHKGICLGHIVSGRAWTSELSIPAPVSFLLRPSIHPFIHPTVKNEPTHPQELCWALRILTNRTGNSARRAVYLLWVLKPKGRVECQKDNILMQCFLKSKLMQKIMYDEQNIKIFNKVGVRYCPCTPHSPPLVSALGTEAPTLGSWGEIWMR